MTKYNVALTREIEEVLHYEVEADSEGAAINAALDRYFDGDDGHFQDNAGISRDPNKHYAEAWNAEE